MLLWEYRNSVEFELKYSIRNFSCMSAKLSCTINYYAQNWSSLCLPTIYHTQPLLRFLRTLALFHISKLLIHFFSRVKRVHSQWLYVIIFPLGSHHYTEDWCHGILIIRDFWGIKISEVLLNSVGDL